MTPKLFVALPCYDAPRPQFSQCLEHLLLAPPCNIMRRYQPGDSLIPRARNTLTADFLASDATHLLFIDTDLVFSTEHVARLLDHELPVVGGFYPKKQDGSLQWVCNALPEGPKADARGLQPLKYIGTGFMLIERDVFRRQREHWPELAYKADGSGREEFDYWSVGVREFPDGTRRYLSEDWFFCQRCLDLGIPIYGDTAIILKHLGAACYPLMSQANDLLAVKPCVLAHCPESHKHHVAQVFAGEYAIPLDPPPATVLDIGACVGAFSAWARLQWPNAAIVAYEPWPANAAMFRQNLPLVDLRPVGVRAQAGGYRLSPGADNCGEATFFREADPNAQRVFCEAADNVPSCEFVKIDTEGCEGEILRGLDLSKTRAIAIEYHSAEDLAELRVLLEDRGFREHWSGPHDSIGVLKAVR